MDNLLDFTDLEDVLSEFNSVNDGRSEQILNEGMNEEMVASQKRYEQYIKKHEHE